MAIANNISNAINNYVNQGKNANNKIAPVLKPIEQIQKNGNKPNLTSAENGSRIDIKI